MIKKIIRGIKKFFMRWELDYNYNLYYHKRITYLEYRRREQKIRNAYNIRY